MLKLYLAELGILGEVGDEADDSAIELRSLAIAAVKPDISPSEMAAALRSGSWGSVQPIILCIFRHCTMIQVSAYVYVHWFVLAFHVCCKCCISLGAELVRASRVPLQSQHLLWGQPCVFALVVLAASGRFALAHESLGMALHMGAVPHLACGSHYSHSCRLWRMISGFLF